MNKQELLKNLEKTLEAEKATQDTEIQKIVKEITNTLKNSLEAELKDVPKGIKSYMVSRIFWTSTLLVLIGSVLLVALGGAVYGKKLKAEIQELRQAKASLQEFEPYTKLNGIEILIGEGESKGKIYFSSKSKKVRAYELENGYRVMSIEG